MSYGQMFTALSNNIFVQPYMDAYRDAYNPLDATLTAFSHASIYTKLLNVNATDVGGLAGMVVGLAATGYVVPANAGANVLNLGILFMDAAGIPYSNLSNAQVGKGAILRGLPLIAVRRYQIENTANNGTLAYHPGDVLVTGASTSYLKKLEAETTGTIGYVRDVLADGTLVVQLAI